jgi:hypothetical protein
MTLDLNQLQVDSFSTSAAGDPSQWGAAAEPTTTTGTMTYAFSCVDAQNGGVADTFVCAGVAALTDVYPCKTTR